MGSRLASLDGERDVKRWSAVAVMVAALCGVTVTAAGTARAHAGFEASNPARGSVVAVLPAVVELTFTEVVGLPADVAVTNPNGVDIATGDVSVIDRTASRSLAVLDPLPGAYVIAYQVTSADGHPIAGTVAFTLDPSSGPPSLGSSAPAPADEDGSASSNRPITSDGGATSTHDHSGSSHTSAPSEVATAITTMTTSAAIAAQVSTPLTFDRESGDANPTAVVLLLIAAVSGMALTGLAVRRSVRHLTASTKASTT